MSTLAVEFIASRMLQTMYGTSNIVWANVIGLVLLFLTLGYFIGGKLADRYPSPSMFYWLVAVSGFASAFFLLLTSFVLRETVTTLAENNIGAVVGSFLSVIIALAIPITLLGCLSPFAIRLAVKDVTEAGKISGRIYAISTWGSLMGTYLPVLYVIPNQGSRMAALLFGSVLLVTGIAGIFKYGKHKAIALLLPLILLPVGVEWTSGHIKRQKNAIFETESEYNYVQVRRVRDCNYLFLNEGAVVHSEYCDGGRVSRYTVYTTMLAAPYFNDPAYVAAKLKKPLDRIAVVGLGAGLVPKLFEKAFGPTPIDGIEIDPAVVQAGRDYFEMNEPNLNVIVGDGRYEFNRLQHTYDMVIVDAYKPPYIPWHMTTEEFFSEIKSKLNDHGVVAINVFRMREDRSLSDALTNTLLKVFPSVHTIDDGIYNTALIATVQPTSKDNFLFHFAQLRMESNNLLRNSMRQAERELVKTSKSDIVFTDEVAPVETVIDGMILRFALEGGAS